MSYRSPLGLILLIDMKDSKTKTALLIGAGFLVPMLAARASRMVAGGGYSMITRKSPPKNPANRDTELREAILWTAFAGALGGVARMFARRYLSENTSLPSEGDDMGEEAERLG